ncbi:hypothetical protein [Rhizobium leucaenae]|uniref:hypothetical protein n=1 Tax=Rhizobium leucaenae TaxID=29450 RepID=UPI00161A133A|nr:hypothetical protein [Rhizobium leucaenae]MBB6299916.1 hypothetical protein [Rhizobium leucaenae]
MAEVIYAGDAGLFKACTKCEDLKNTSDFSVQKTVKSGRRSVCKSCESSASLLRYERKRDVINAQKRALYAEGPAKHRERSMNWHYENHDRSLDRARSWKLENPDKVTSYNRSYYAENADRLKADYASWAADNAPKRRDYMRGWYDANPGKHSEYSSRRRESLKFRIESAMRCRIWSGITSGSKGDRRTIDLLEFSIADLMHHLESKFLPGMSFDNYGDWHIDHIRPLASFDYETPDDPEFKLAWALSNLQPLWAADNIAKGAKWRPDNDNQHFLEANAK